MQKSSPSITLRLRNERMRNIDKRGRVLESGRVSVFNRAAQKDWFLNEDKKMMNAMKIRLHRMRVSGWKVS